MELDENNLDVFVHNIDGPQETSLQKMLANICTSSHNLSTELVVAKSL